MTDRELLELAAKAVNKIIVRHAEPGDKFTGLLVCGDDWAPSEVWNPLTDDGDALRLAAVLKIDLEWQHEDDAVEAYIRNDELPSIYCPSYAASEYKRAIVDVAAHAVKAQP